MSWCYRQDKFKYNTNGLSVLTTTHVEVLSITPPVNRISQQILQAIQSDHDYSFKIDNGFNYYDVINSRVKIENDEVMQQTNDEMHCDDEIFEHGNKVENDCGNSVELTDSNVMVDEYMDYDVIIEPSIVQKSDSDDSSTDTASESGSMTNKLGIYSLERSNDEVKCNMSNKEDYLKIQDGKRNHPKYKSGVYKCMKCLLKFTKRERWKEHMEKHSKSSGRFICKICEQRFITSAFCEEHYREHHAKREGHSTYTHNSKPASKTFNNGRRAYRASQAIKTPPILKYKRPVMTEVEESNIADWIHYLGDKGFHVSKDQLIKTVQKLVEKSDRPKPYKDGFPGNRWFQKFLTRHPSLVDILVEKQSHSTKLTEQEIRAWFQKLRDRFEKNNDLYLLQDPSRLYTCDETAFCLRPNGKDVLLKKTSKRAITRAARDKKEFLTMCVNVSASGLMAPPMILFPYKRLSKTTIDTVPSWWGVACTGTWTHGWMNMDAFENYVTNVFYKWLLEHDVKLPIVLFMDGNTSQISLQLSQFCQKSGIILVAFPNSAEVLQPLDVILRPVEAYWQNVLHIVGVENRNARMKCTDFACQAQKCFNACLLPEAIKNSFRNTGIFPFNPDVVDYTKALVRKESDISKLCPMTSFVKLERLPLITSRTLKVGSQGVVKANRNEVENNQAS